MGKFIRDLRACWRRIWQEPCGYPALDITLPHCQLHLVGSIHMGTRTMQPLPEALLARLAQADALIVEADITHAASPFSEAEVCAPLAERLTPQAFSDLQQRCEELGIDAARVETLPAWQVALMLQAQQAQRLGLHADCGIDYQLLRAARQQQKPIIELEGAETQLALLKSLSDNGLPLLLDTLQHWQVNARLLQTMIGWWLATPPRHRDRFALPDTFSSGLNELLMHQRNRQWQQTLRQLPPGHYVVAVGALHLYGDGNLPDLLQEK
ncbi:MULTISPECIES: TraB/GumN family protein [unclassified Erwinia]|uniref:TraB/GumN family protein n=1 Tax=unclassified Erwinia TaxID=2622719 RepID=UPI0006F899CC|nr:MULTISPECIES: TraB/GumN family protein [unclassified Erwinia]KQN54406.1 conjugal transfer protein TraB [Erwinia sp. Leaf53]PLV59674.1 conjugal transfer protein TraB [Erwinia sp. B116]